MKHQLTRDNNNNILKLQLINPMKIMPPPFNTISCQQCFSRRAVIRTETGLDNRGPQTMKPKGFKTKNLILILKTLVPLKSKIKSIIVCGLLTLMSKSLIRESNT